MLLTRVMTAAILLAIVLSCLFVLPPWAFGGLLLVFAVAGAWEWSRIAGLEAAQVRAALSIASGALAGLALLRPPLAEALIALALVWWLLALLVLAGERLPATRDALFSRGVQTLLALLVPASTVAALGLLFAGGSRPWLVVTVLLIVWAADIGAYFAGRAFGRRPLAPVISPNKTWEGALGGALAAVLVGVPLLVWASSATVPIAVLVVAVLIVAAVVGDLVESASKRHAGIKDSGALLPGHGGVLDRVDSLLSAAPVMAALVLAGVA